MRAISILSLEDHGRYSIVRRCWLIELLDSLCIFSRLLLLHCTNLRSLRLVMIGSLLMMAMSRGVFRSLTEKENSRHSLFNDIYCRMIASPIKLLTLKAMAKNVFENSFPGWKKNEEMELLGITIAHSTHIKTYTVWRNVFRLEAVERLPSTLFIFDVDSEPNWCCWRCRCGIGNVPASAGRKPAFDCGCWWYERSKFSGLELRIHMKIFCIIIIVFVLFTF